MFIPLYGKIDHSNVPKNLRPNGGMLGTIPGLSRLVFNRMPWEIKNEINQISEIGGYSLEDALALTLSYETGGSACKTCVAWNDDLQEYRMLRILEWALSDDASGAVEWQNLKRDARARVYPGYTGVLTGYREDSGEAIAMNLSPDWGTDYNVGGEPVTHVIRKCLVSRGKLIDNVMESGPVVTPSWAIVKEPKECFKVLFSARGDHKILDRVSEDTGCHSMLIQNCWDHDPEILKGMEKIIRDSVCDYEGTSYAPRDLPYGVGDSGIAVDAVLM